MKKTSQTLTTQRSVGEKIADVNADLSNLNKKISHYSTYQGHIESLISDEAKLRKNIEKKTFLMNENFNDEIKKIRSSINEIDKKVDKAITDLKSEINIDVKNRNNKLLSTVEANMEKFADYERNFQNLKDDKLLKLHEFENKISILEELTGNQFTIIKNEIYSTNSKLDGIQSQLINNNAIFSNDINKIKEDVYILKNEVDKLKGGRNFYNEGFSKLQNQVDVLSSKNDKVNHDMDLLIKDIQIKLKNYESIKKMFSESLVNVKNDVNVQFEDFNKNSNDSYNKLKENLLNEIKKNKVDMDKFHITIIQENQKFIDYSENQNKSQNENVKKLFDYTNEDIEILKKKSETLENIIKNIRTEMISNINNVELYLTQRYDNMFKTMSMSSERIGLN